jgi:hypothetical protein
MIKKPQSSIKTKKRGPFKKIKIKKLQKKGGGAEKGGENMRTCMFF